MRGQFPGSAPIPPMPQVPINRPRNAPPPPPAEKQKDKPPLPAPPAEKQKEAPPPLAKPAPAQQAPAAPPAPPANADMRQQMMQKQMQQMQMMQKMQPGNVRIGLPAMKAMYGQLMLKDGKPKKLPTDDRTAVRIRAGKSDALGNVPEGEIILPLELSLEPKLQYQSFQSIRIDKAVDDRDKNVSQVNPQVEGVPGGGAGGPALATDGDA